MHNTLFFKVYLGKLVSVLAPILKTKIILGIFYLFISSDIFWFKALSGNVSEDLRTRSYSYSVVSLFLSISWYSHACSLPSIVALLEAGQSLKKKNMFLP